MGALVPEKASHGAQEREWRGTERPLSIHIEGTRVPTGHCNLLKRLLLAHSDFYGGGVYVTVENIMKYQGQPLLTQEELSDNVTNEGIERTLVILYLINNVIH